MYSPFFIQPDIKTVVNLSIPVHSCGYELPLMSSPFLPHQNERQIGPIILCICGWHLQTRPGRNEIQKDVIKGNNCFHLQHFSVCGLNRDRPSSKFVIPQKHAASLTVNLQDLVMKTWFPKCFSFCQQPVNFIKM